jgi:DNA-binding NtrC family response regulator
MPDRARILIVDDEDVVVASGIRTLEADGHELCSASTGEEALEKLASDPFDVALLDLRIPRPGGLMLLRYIRDTFPGTRVVVMTGYPTLENAKEAIQLGAFDYVRKPLHPDRLRAVVSRALARRGSAFQRPAVSAGP